MPKQSRNSMHSPKHHRNRTDCNDGNTLGKFKMPDELEVGDVVRLRKAHPCGSHEWEVVRVGADIGVKCLACQRKVFLERGVFRRRLERVVGKKE